MRRVHRLTPLLHLWSVILALLAAAIFNLNSASFAAIGAFIEGRSVLWPILIGLGGFVALCALVWLLSYFWWKATWYEVGEEELTLSKGVFSTQRRTTRYERVQAVDVAESLIARIFRVASVRVETAGGTSSNIKIEFLSCRDAERLRSEVLAKVRAAHGEDQVPPEEELIDAPTPEEGLLIEVPIQRSLAGAALSGATLIGVPLLVGMVLLPVGNLGALAALLGVAGALWQHIDSSWKFRSHYEAEEDLLHVSFGLADRRRQAIPLKRIHGVRIQQPLLWRLVGWWRVEATVVGYGLEGDESGTSRLLPVGSREEAMAVCALITELDRREVEAYAAPEGHSNPAYTSPDQAWIASPIDRAKQSVSICRDVLITHWGRFSRRVELIHASHIQELTLRQGPIQQLMDLSTVRFDLVPGPVNMYARDLSLADARELLARLRGWGR